MQYSTHLLCLVVFLRFTLQLHRLRLDNVFVFLQPVFEHLNNCFAFVEFRVLESVLTVTTLDLLECNGARVDNCWVSQYKQRM